MTHGNHPPHVEQLLGRLKGVTPSGAGWVACCPAHDDHRPSLGVDVATDGTILVKCRSAGCSTEAITRSLGVPLAALFPPRPGGLGDRIAAAYDYRDERGGLLFQVVRLRDPKDFRQRKPDAGRWTWKTKDVRKVPYRLPELLAADPARPVFVVEGEKDADRLAALGLTATTNPAGAGKWRHLDAAAVRAAFTGRVVVVLPDNDGPGRQHAADVAERLAGIAATVRVVELPDLPDKGDVSDWLDAGGTAEALLDLARVGTAPGCEHEARSAGGCGESGEPIPPGGETDTGDRPEIVLGPDEYRVNAEAAASLGRHGALYQRGGMLVSVVSHAAADERRTDAVRRPVGALVIRPLPAPLVRERLTETARFGW